MLRHIRPFVRKTVNYSTKDAVPSLKDVQIELTIRELCIIIGIPVGMFTSGIAAFQVADCLKGDVESVNEHTGKKYYAYEKTFAGRFQYNLKRTAFYTGAIGCGFLAGGYLGARPLIGIPVFIVSSISLSASID